MTLPNFILCGAQKSGTSALYEYLQMHPNICMNGTYFFYWDFLYKRGKGWYEKRFDKGRNDKLIGEYNADYMYNNKVPKRIHQLLPDIKLIFILRNPVDRAYSHYWHNVIGGQETLKSFEKATDIEKERINKNFLYKHWFSYLDRGKYVIQLKRFLELFPKSQLFVIKSEDLWNKRKETLSALFDFLNVNSDFIPVNIKSNPSGEPRIWSLQQFYSRYNPFVNTDPRERYKKNLFSKALRTIFGQGLRHFIKKINIKKGYPSMKSETRNKLKEYFKEYNVELENLLDIDVSVWNK